MKSYKNFAFLFVLAFGGAISGEPTAAQTAVSSPVVVQQLSPKPIWLKAEVIHFDSNAITVREVNDERMIHTFTYGPHAQSDIQKVLNNGGYQYGDKVKIRYKKGQTVALSIHGKASKPANPAPVAPLKPATPRITN
jgi:hypothetical protein